MRRQNAPLLMGGTCTISLPSLNFTEAEGWREKETGTKGGSNGQKEGELRGWGN